MNCDEPSNNETSDSTKPAAYGKPIYTYEVMNLLPRLQAAQLLEICKIAMAQLFRRNS